jgi:hypothetical protein
MEAVRGDDAREPHPNGFDLPDTPPVARISFSQAEDRKTMNTRGRSLIVVCIGALSLAGCASWSTANIDTRSADAPRAGAAAPIIAKKSPAQVQLTDKDVADRKYVSLGDISVTVNKTTIFNADPTPEMVNQKLREKAADMGADAVVLVRYGKGGVSLMSWGSLEGKGRAVKYLP